MTKALVIALALIATSAWGSEQALRQAQSLINDGRHGEARRVLEPLEAQYIGDPRYDYLIGLALLETGEPGRAVLALQRAIATEPRFAAARLDLARAYYASGNLGEAQQEFEALRDENPPPAARRAIDQYLALIANRQRRLRMEYRLSTRAGYDSNANSATAVDNFLGFDLIEQSRETSSPFAEFGGSVTMLKPFSQSLLLDTRLGVRQRNNPDASFVNSQIGNASLGLRHVTEKQTRSLRLQGYQVEVDGRDNSAGLALAGSWDFNVRRNLRLGVLGRIGQVKYGDELKVKDVDQYLLGITSNWTYAGGRGSLGGSLLAGTDEPLQADSRYGRDTFGLRFTAGWNFSSQFRAQFTAGLLQSDYDAVFFEQQFDAPREDTLTQLSVKLDWRITPKWLMSHLVAYTNNDTDVDVFEFERVETSLSINRVWR
ncbi:MAG: tetratricopeptide repeat protein [Gammaproteobacteria bacterium]|nr:tetratricopeptide repeat protein [Gammaproteobacteria bacterium]NNF61290.1 tetratricopeptide repeat protein [Gammaproteobacteria bacterium]